MLSDIEDGPLDTVLVQPVSDVFQLVSEFDRASSLLVDAAMKRHIASEEQAHPAQHNVTGHGTGSIHAS